MQLAVEYDSDGDGTYETQVGSEAGSGDGGSGS
jgi:hypothetical protein